MTSILFFCVLWLIFLFPIGEFSMITVMSSSYDLKEAVKKYRFMLYPKVQSELHPLPAGEFMASDEQTYRLWVKSLQRVIRALESDHSVESTMRCVCLCLCLCVCVCVPELWWFAKSFNCFFYFFIFAELIQILKWLLPLRRHTNNIFIVICYMIYM